MKGELLFQDAQDFEKAAVVLSTEYLEGIILVLDI